MNRCVLLVLAVLCGFASRVHAQGIPQDVTKGDPLTVLVYDSAANTAKLVRGNYLAQDKSLMDSPVTGMFAAQVLSGSGNSATTVSGWCIKVGSTLIDVTDQPFVTLLQVVDPATMEAKLVRGRALGKWNTAEMPIVDGMYDARVFVSNGGATSIENGWCYSKEGKLTDVQDQPLLRILVADGANWKLVNGYYLGTPSMFMDPPPAAEKGLMVPVSVLAQEIVPPGMGGGAPTKKYFIKNGFAFAPVAVAAVKK
jgi:hypothetical protein